MKAIILKKNIFSEGNEIITMYCQEFGKIRAVARATKSPKSKMAYALQPLFLTDIELAPAKNLPSIVGVKPLKTFPNIQQSLEKIYPAMFATELILKSTADQQPNQELFNAYLALLEHLDQSQSPTHNCVYRFAMQAMALTGYQISFGACAGCGKSLAGQEQIYFSNRKGAFLCADCAAKTSQAQAISQAAYGFFAQNNSNFNQADLQNIPNKELHALVQGFISHVLERSLNAADYLAKLK